MNIWQAMYHIMDVSDTRRIIFEFAYQTKYSTKYLIETLTKRRIINTLGLRYSVIDTLTLENILYRSIEKKMLLYCKIDRKKYRSRLL